MSNKQTTSFRDLIREQYRQSIHDFFDGNDAMLKAVDNMSDKQFDETLNIADLIDHIVSEIDLFASEADCYVDYDE